jgi:4-diphosphocytidyl-2-C-methyl-D-erythritol kinase
MVTFPHAKINLGLKVLRKRPDGYHDLETCFYPVPWNDILEIIPANDFKFSSSGLAIHGSADNNLCVKAYNLLKNDFKLPPVHIHLHKIIPMGAGLGGGSSDAAFTLLQLNDSFELGLSIQALQNYAAQLGSDCAFFVSSEPKIGTGRGEILTQATVSLNGKFLVAVKPDIHVSTADAFAGIVPGGSQMSITEVLMKPIAEWKQFLKNDFEHTIFEKYPAIKSLKDELYNSGAIYASMSGSGSSMFGIFEEPLDLATRFPEAEYWSGVLN